MKNDFYFLVLKELIKNNGLETKVDMSNFMSHYFPNHNTLDQYWDQKNSIMESFLEKMKKSGHIQYESTLLEPKENSLIKGTQVIISLTIPGYEFYKQHKRNFWTRVLAWIAIVISAVAAFFAGYQAFNTHSARPEETKSQSVKSKTQ